jgi:hypothetical protein
VGHKAQQPVRSYLLLDFRGGPRRLTPVLVDLPTAQDGHGEHHFGSAAYFNTEIPCLYFRFNNCFYYFGEEANHGLHAAVDRPQRPTRSMNSVRPDESNEQTPNSRSRSRDRPKSKPKPNPKKRKPKRRSDTGKGWFKIRDIIDEKIEHGEIQYLIDWVGVDKNGLPYDPTWVCYHALGTCSSLQSTTDHGVGTGSERDRGCDQRLERQE